MRVRRALLSVSDKTGLVPFAQGLREMNVQLLSTGGTYKTLLEAGVEVTEVSEHTGFPEMMDGRVKTLHPMIHGGILARRDLESHQQAMEQHGIAPIDLVVVNLYPFEATVAKPGVTRAEAIEQIDIGGPSMVRSAAKNHASVGIVTDVADYEKVLAEMRTHDGALSQDTREHLALKAFARTAQYDAHIERYLTGHAHVGNQPFPPLFQLEGALVQELRYGENPHQRAAFYRTVDSGEPSVGNAEVLGGKALSYNNLVDLDAALALAKEFAEPFCCVIKHTNPCGAAIGANLAEAIERAWSGDPVSAFGSVLAMNRSVDLAVARFLVEGQRFVEAIIAPSFDSDALELLTTGPKWGKNVRLLACGSFDPSVRQAGDWEVKKLTGGLLLQDRDLDAEEPAQMRVVTQTSPDAAQLEELAFAQRIAKHVKSNAIVLTGQRTVYGVGAGQMSRVDSVRMAVLKAGERAGGSVLASDAFFPFPDGVELAIENGIAAIVEPGGSMRDAEVIAACDAKQVPMVFTGIRHFRH
ncbi:MAG TPA: bifunctional phosphoribosylaminoimidazolecarboxamide formyltransferase/IMP cyclohydrolase [Planctomycetota bacterium]|nr:bifunctional phosphoribosylaminoimidazolecarboxamide formyltransferase/IMP cyclohydrolase [Planctomycetota bacterium]